MGDATIDLSMPSAPVRATTLKENRVIVGSLTFPPPERTQSLGVEGFSD